MSENNAEMHDSPHHHEHQVRELFLDGAPVTTRAHRLTGLQIRELGPRDRIQGFKTEIVSGHVRVIGDLEEVEVHNEEHFRTVIEIYLDGELVISHSKMLTGLQIRELGPADRVEGFETQEVDRHGKKIRTIGDNEKVDIHEHERFRTVPTTEVQVPPSEELLKAVADLGERSGYVFQISPEMIPGTNLFVVHTVDHPFRPEYTVTKGVLGFRVPSNFPDAAPEDSFFIMPTTVKLVKPDPTRNSIDLNRASRADNLVLKSDLGEAPVLLFSWHLWDRAPWNRRVHTLIDHYNHCIRRFEQPEHD